ncbi:hypothetical protein Q9S78_01125 [Microbacterium sp. KSW-18]|uniref:Uncharacterized protein n=1 Tax=Microbacterium aquilitoris TaxID=3067307 RepID=A0ABU3GEY9_9MICO|nr:MULTISPECIES: hypothetical protein [unclassified Microbacterium]MDT3329259.1 hypothetical protein [Microbacterium sp. KSW-18]
MAFMTPRKQRTMVIVVLTISALVAIFTAVALPLIFDEPPNWWSVLGAVCTCAAMIILLAELRRRERQDRDNNGPSDARRQ